jgi:xanthine dehydrogenase accessory factor
MTSHEFADLLAGFRQLQENGFSGGAALATLVHTHGAVFRRAGARMLIFGDGRIVRGLSAGCPEADIAARAGEVIATGQARLLRYDREHGYDALLELGCGGELEVLLEPLRGPADLRFAEAVEQCLRTRCPGVLVTVFAQDGHCLPQPRRLVWCERVLLDEFDDPRLADAALSQALADETAPAARMEEFATRSGPLRALVERLLPPLRLVIIGLNTTALALARLVHGLGWPVVLVDHREDGGTQLQPGNAERICATPQALSGRVPLDARTAVVVMTHNLERDIAYLQTLRTQPLAYLGALGSRKRAAQMREALGTGAAPLHSPAGLDIGSETPEEIALAIAAEIQGVVNGHGGGPLSAGDGPIH